MKVVLKKLRERQSLREHFQKYNNTVNKLLFVWK